MTISKISDLKEAEYNPRTITEESFKGLKFSIDEFGDLSGIVFNKKTGSLVAGHQRLKAIKDQYGDVNIINNQILLPNGEVFNVRIVDWDQKKEKAANIAANNPHIQGEFTSGLAVLLEELKIDLPDIVTELKFDEISIPKIVLTDEEKQILNDVPEISSEAISQKGDIFILDGKHRVMCGDSTSRTDVELLMDGKLAKITHTDPPYNVDYGANKKHPSWNVRAIIGDKQNSEQWEMFCKDFIKNIIEFTTGDIYVWGASGPEGMKMRLALVENKCHWSSTIIWKKQQLVLSPAKYQRMYEPCFYGWHNKSSFVADRKQTEVWEFDRPRKSDLHPTMKPVELCANAIANSSNVADIVLDLFLGSGSTLIAAAETNRTCYGLELDPIYVDVILKRYKALYPKASFECLSREFNFEELFNNA